MGAVRFSWVLPALGLCVALIFLFGRRFPLPWEQSHSLRQGGLDLQGQVGLPTPLLQAVASKRSLAPRFHAPQPEAKPLDPGRTGRDEVPLNLSAAQDTNFSWDEGVCKAKKPTFQETTRTALVSYPGSGNTVFRMLLEVSTGVWTGSVYGDETLFRGWPYPFRGETTQQGVIAIKTHAPWGPQWYPRATRAVILIRDPRASIPSLCNYIYGSTLVDRSDHSVQAPQEYWERWRDDNFARQVRDWGKIVSYWMNLQLETKVVVYEDLVHPVKGPTVLREVTAFLDSPISKDWAQCVWTDVLRSRSSGIHRRKKYRASFSYAQECAISAAMTQLADKFSSNSVLEPVLRSYVRSCPMDAASAAARLAAAYGESDDDDDEPEPDWLSALKRLWHKT